MVGEVLHVRAAFELTVEAFDRVVRPDIQARVRVTGDEGHVQQISVGCDPQSAEELGPEVCRRRVAERHPENIPALASARDASGDHESLRDDAAAAADVEMGGV